MVHPARIRLEPLDAHPAQLVFEASGRVDVEKADGARIPLREAVRDPGRRCDVGAGRRARPLAVDVDVELPLQDVEGIRLVVVGVRVGAVERAFDL
jgi:hypothetical protein